MILYACVHGKSFGTLPGGLPAALAHPCGRAAAALDRAGHEYEMKTVKGGSAKFWTWPTRAQDRAEVEKLSGQRAVPVLLLDSGEVVSGSAEIARWAESRPAVT